ncbi:hypothetical protein BOTCAL_0174g00060 [Botryotinia calthae]|uniref:Uncharacterized protein n=1 Tax=Botryotinia calthae TaxID=38488 RepID=A0A4Y8D0V8_9HELO|nr:hypothetical protein BOTCAL_0174g00060 [Botryotinia calthae]
MKADLENGKFTQEQIEEIRKLMEEGAKKMNLPHGEAPGELTLEQWKEKATKLEAELKTRGKEGDKYLAQLMALQDQLRRAEIENLKMETRNVKLEKERKEAMALVDAATKETRDKKNQEDKEKEDEKHAKALRDKDHSISLLKEEIDALSKRLEADKKEREEAAAKDTDKEKNAEVQTLQKQAIQKDEIIKKLEKDLEEEKHKNDLEEAGYHAGENLKVAVQRLEEEKKRLKKEAAKLGETIADLNGKIRKLESSQVRYLDAALDSERKEKERERLEINFVELKKRVQQFEDEEKIQIKREQELLLSRQTLGAQVLRLKTQINQLNEALNQSKEKATKYEETIKNLRKAVHDSSGELGREFLVLGAEIKKLEARVKEQDAKILQQGSEIRAQKKTIGEQTLKIRVGTPGESHGELALQNQTIFKENLELKKQLEILQKNLDADQSEELKKQLEASQSANAAVQKRVEELLKELEEVRVKKIGEGANADEVKRLMEELKKATAYLQKSTQDTKKVIDENERLKEDVATKATLIQTVMKQLKKFTTEIGRLNEMKTEDAEMIRHLNEENNANKIELARLWSLQIPAPPIAPSQKELEYNQIRVRHFEEQEVRWRKREAFLDEKIEENEKQIEELKEITQQSEDLINDMTVEQKSLQEITDKLKLELASAATKPIDDTGDAAERERVHAEKIKELTERNSALSAQVNVLEEERKKVRKSVTGTSAEAEKEKRQLNQQQAKASAQTIQMLMGFMILQRALNGKVKGDMKRVLAAVEQARLQAEEVGDEKVIVEISNLVAIAAYYDGDTAKALASFNAIKESKHLNDSEQDVVERWITQCEKGADCPKGRSGYREALGFGPAPPSFHAPPKDEEAKKARKEARKAAKKAAKRMKAGTKPKTASAPIRRGIHRPDLYVGILSPRQQQIWDGIDFSDFDYNHLTTEQKSLFSFFPIDSEPESPRRPVVHRAAGPSTAGSALPAPRPHFDLPPLPPSSSDSEGPPPPPAPPRPQRKTKPEKPDSSGASSAASVKGAQGAQGGQTSRMSRPTTDAALHIQYLVARLAESVRRVKELEGADADVVSLTARVGRRDAQIEELRIYCEQIVAENTALQGNAA